ncbi:hypothetical protein [Streptantibioticus rubrisoli]|uniref:Uncharacterized protein n=1 Tax=Streptantibioticus rubrisoli TaxID=1387313 RepID=A0ABT1P7R0_9ACTN|nr:hypothetical protein [Streptantibioticus rubrisoli]MCQ4041411.1 hypothetical protein [Streptantibioticus rubrisoli]
MVRRLADRAHAWFDRTPPPVLHPAIAIALDTYTGLYRLRLRAVAEDPAALLHRKPTVSRRARLRLSLPAPAQVALACALFPFPTRPATAPA